jgi:oligopeptide/dipeptide ABC transporter ATP-binding protein
MYGGEIAEIGGIHELYAHPQHPYTERLLGAFPAVGGPRKLAPSIPGIPPDPASLPQGCRFHPRCHKARDVCGEADVELRRLGSDHAARCLFAPWPEGELASPSAGKVTAS